MKEIFLLPGEFYIAKDPSIIRTILGSCVSVILYDRETTFAGINHYLLPQPGPLQGDQANSSRYGDIAIDELYKRLISAGVRPRMLSAKLYGGAAVITSLHKGFLIGEQNIAMAQQKLNKLRIPIIESCIGGERGRKIELLSHQFQVRVDFISKQ